MLFTLMKLAHLIGILLVSAGLFSVLVQDILSRRMATQESHFSAVRVMTVSYNALTLPGAAVLFASGGWLIANYYGPIEVLVTPWLGGMVGLFSLWLIVLHVKVRLDLRRLGRLFNVDHTLRDIETLRNNGFSMFVLGLDVSLLILILTLGTFQPQNWVMVLAGIGFALEWALIATVFLPGFNERAKRRNTGAF
ncbi:DUF2269 family protein [Shimia sediminis]|uniref:DUF2269 family protein n=1 Tax=Shimia sediminis TaxID=2497945 RepID=UPI000F8F2D3D|nr:DUF2269 family protein [Shimia sediminis]